MLKLLAITLLTWLTAVQTVAAAAVQEEDCRDFINETVPRVTCGFVSVPLDHSKPDGQQITLPVLIARSTRTLLARSEHAILIPGAGGPGAAMGFGYQYYPGEFLKPYQGLLQAGFDIVVLDQRGAGYSVPRLSCHETAAAFKALVVRERTLDDEITGLLKATTRCRERLHNVPVSQFDTAQSAMDFLKVMDSLPYRWWGTLATSYATTIAQAMLHLKPDAFQRVVLDSPVPLDYQKPLTLEGTYKAVKKSIVLCRNNPRCHRKYPKLDDQFNAVIARAKEQPYRLRIKVLDESYKTIRPTLVIDDATLLAIFSNAIYSNEGIAALPKAIDSLHSGRADALSAFAVDFWYQSTDTDYADGLNLSVHCAERQILEQQYIAANPDYMESLSAESRRVLQSQTDNCKAWRVSSNNTLLPAKRFAPPTLVLAGTLDPVIEQEDISHTTDDFSNIATRKIPGAGHAVWFQSACVRESVVEFFTGNAISALNHCQLQLPQFK